MSDNTTNVQKVEIDDNDLNSFLDMGNATNVMLPEDNKKPSFFAPQKVDLGFLSNRDKAPAKPADKITPIKDEETPVVTPTKSAPESTPSLDEVLNEIDPLQEEITKPAPTSGGRPKVSKDGTIELVKKLIDNKTLVPFDDDKNIEDYSIQDFQELIDANFKDREDKIRQQTPAEFYDQLPEEMQIAAKYIADGGQDLRGLFKVLAQVEDTRALSADIPEEGESITRQYLGATNFGTPDEIEDQITEWKDLNKLEEKAQKFKPKLEALTSERVAYKLAQQEQIQKQRAQAAQNYAASIYETLKPAELNGLKLDKKTQGMIYAGLIQPNYPSMSGNSTNLFGHLIEKYQYVEPNHSLIAEALWLLADPESYRSRVREQGKAEATEKTVRMLKTEESRKIASSPVIEKEETRQRTIPRNDNFFKR